MPRVILQPCAGTDAFKHYQDTILNPVPLDRMKGHLDQMDLTALAGLYPGGAAPTWGVTPGGANPSKWNRMAPGDVALFSRQGRIFSSGVVRYKAHNQSLALDLWKRDKDGQTWEFLYFLDELRDEDIPYAALNQARHMTPIL